MFITTDIRAAFGRTAALSLVLACAACASAQGPAQSQGQQPSQEAAAEQEKPEADEPAKPPAPKPLTATSADGTKIVYETTGTGPAMIMLHGGGQTRRSWNDQGYVEKLKDRFTVITVDLRGSGESGKPTTPEAYALDRMLEDITAVADAANATRFHLWGFGHGASIGRYLAARSDRVISMVYAGAPMGPPVTGVVKEAIEGMRAKWQPLVEQQQAGTLNLDALSPGDKTAWENGVATTAIALGALAAYPPLEPSEIKVPTLWVVGSDDAAAMESVKAYEGKLEGTKVTLAVVDGLSYSDTFAKSEPVLAKVEPFLTANLSTTS